MTWPIWKSREKKLAQSLSGRRSGATGASSPDVENEWLSVEVKSRKSLPQWIEEALIQAERNRTEGKLPLVLIHKNGQRYKNDWVVLRYSDFMEYFGGG